MIRLAEWFQAAYLAVLASIWGESPDLRLIRRLGSKRLAHGFVEEGPVDQRGQLRTSARCPISFFGHPHFFFHDHIKKIGNQTAA